MTSIGMPRLALAAPCFGIVDRAIFPRKQLDVRRTEGRRAPSAQESTDQTQQHQGTAEPMKYSEQDEPDDDRGRGNEGNRQQT